MPSSDRKLLPREDEEFLEKMKTELDWCATWFPELQQRAHALRDAIIEVLRTEQRLVGAVERDEHGRVLSGHHRVAAAEVLDRHSWVGASGPWAIRSRGGMYLGYVPDATSEAVAVERYMNAHPRVVSAMDIREHEITATRIV